MSEQSIERVRLFVEAYNAGDIEMMVAYCDPDIEFHSVFAAAGGDVVYHGHDGMREWHRDIEPAWGGDTRSEPTAHFDLGEHTLAFLVMRGRRPLSEAPIALPIALVVRWRNGLIDYLKTYVSRDDALNDLGVSEDELEPIGP